MTRQERTALGVVALLLALGAGARWLGADAPPAEWSAAPGAGGEERGEASRLLARSEDEAERAERASRPLGAGERIDPSTASAEELDRLPKVGPGLAARIVAHRAAHGRFRTLADLDAVPGVGPALLAAAAPHLALAPAPAGAAASAGPAARHAASAPAPAGGTVDLNSATAAELEALPGIGPALAKRIVAHRASHGRFRSPAELDAVPGIGKKSLERLLPLVHASP